MSAASFKRKPVQLTYVQNELEPRAAAGDELSQLPPTLPPIPYIGHKSSFVNLFNPASVCDEGGEAESQTTALHLSEVKQITLKLRRTAPSTILRSSNMEGRQRPVLSIETGAHYPKVSTTLRYTSSGSSTLRSRQSDGASSDSRPSSRSSIDETPDLLYGTRKQYRNLPAKPGDLTQTNVPAHDIERRAFPSPKIKQRPTSSSIPRNASSKNKPLPPKPDEATTTLPPPLVRRSALGSIRIRTPEPIKTKRGKRLGQQMVGMAAKPTKSSATHLATAELSHQTQDIDSGSASEELEPQFDEPSPSRRSKTSTHGSLSSRTPERVFLRVLSQLDNLEDLRCASMVNKGLHRTFKRYEQDLVSRILYKFSLPAWELRQIMKCEQKKSAFRLRSVQRDTATLRALQSFILMKCEPMCRNTTIEGLSGRDEGRRTEIDNALWRIWTFCKLFGKNKSIGNTFDSQLVWLDGGHSRAKDHNMISLGVGNGDGLSTRELEDLSEMWSCLEALLAGFRDREAEARRAGIFDFCVIEDDVGNTERELLNTWIYDILSLGPKAVLTLTSCSFEQAKVLGITIWTPPEPDQRRTNFLKAAIEHVYRERLVSEARSKASEFAKLVRSQSAPTPTNTNPTIVVTPELISEPFPINENSVSQDFAVPPTKSSSICRLKKPDELHLPPIQQDVRRLSQGPSTPVYSSIALTQGISTRMGATLFPMHHPKHHLAQRSTHIENDSQLSASKEDLGHNKIVDPVDLALWHLVKDRKFQRNDAIRALAMSDNGCGIDLNRAVKLLMKQPVTPRPGPSISELPVPSVQMPARVAPEDMSNTDHSQFAPARSSTNKRKPPLKTRRRSSTPLSIILDTDSEDNPQPEQPEEEPSGYIHQPIDSPIQLSHSSSTGHLPSNLAQLSHKLKITGLPHPHVKARRSTSYQHDVLNTRPHCLDALTHTSTPRANTMPGLGNHGLGFSTTEDKQDEKRASRLWSFKDDTRRRLTKTNSRIGYAF